jgi:hypothetical protein
MVQLATEKTRKVKACAEANVQVVGPGTMVGIRLREETATEDLGAAEDSGAVDSGAVGGTEVDLAACDRRTAEGSRVTPGIVCQSRTCHVPDSERGLQVGHQQLHFPGLGRVCCSCSLAGPCPPPQPASQQHVWLCVRPDVPLVLPGSPTCAFLHWALQSSGLGAGCQSRPYDRLPV